MTVRIGRAVFALGAVGMLIGALTGCGGGSTETTTGQSPASATAATGSAVFAGRSGERRQLDPALQKKIAQCLEAAGLAVPSFSPRPTGQRPTGSPTGSRPSGTGGPRGTYADPRTQAALEACGIQLPTFRAGGSGGPGGSGAPPQGAPTEPPPAS